MLGLKTGLLRFGGILQLSVFGSAITCGLFAQSPETQTPAMIYVADDAESGNRHHPSRVIVRFKAGPSFLPDSKENHRLGDSDLFVVENPPGLSVAETVRHYREDPNVQYVEPDYEVSTTADATDPLWAQQWDMVKIAAPGAWNSQTSASDVIVAVVDTGVDLMHPDL